MNTLQQLLTAVLKAYGIDLIVVRYMELYEETPKDILSLAKAITHVVMSLLQKPALKVDFDIVLKYETEECDGEPLEKPYWSVHGLDLTGEYPPDITLALDFTPWQEWANAKVHMPEGVPDIDVVVHCLWEMTFMGWTEKRQQENSAKLDKASADIDMVELGEWLKQQKANNTSSPQG